MTLPFLTLSSENLFPPLTVVITADKHRIWKWSSTVCFLLHWVRECLKDFLTVAITARHWIRERRNVFNVAITVHDWIMQWRIIFSEVRALAGLRIDMSRFNQLLPVPDCWPEHRKAMAVVAWLHEVTHKFRPKKSWNTASQSHLGMQFIRNIIWDW